ncbi:MAG: histidine phosphatase family protein [Alphaproteobacteria bacterium]|nr:histidine phosphatase family protein [Alphaproteobacteria bacterium]
MIPAHPFVFLRHGENVYNRIGRIQGNRDVALSDTGRAQAEAARQALAGAEVGTVCASPLLRARETADIVNQTLKRPLVVIDELAECGLGELEGQHVPYREWFPRWRAGTGWPEGAEAYENFVARALRGVMTALGHPGPVLIGAHGGIYWSVQRALSLEEGAVIGNAVPLHHEPDADGWRVVQGT